MIQEDIFLHIVTFEMNGELFGVPIMNIQEIIRWTTIVPVPQAPLFVKGVINLRSRVIAVVSLREKFNMGPEKTADEKSRIVIVEINHLVVGFIVDSVHEVLRVDKKDFEETPAVAVNTKHKYVKGIVKQDKQMVLVLCFEEFFSQQEQEILGEVN